MIKFSVRDIGSSGLEAHRVVPKEGIGLSEEEIDLRSPIEVDAQVNRVDSAVIADVKIIADFGFTCARCLEDFHAIQDYKYQFAFDIDAKTEYVDVGEEIRQELIMLNPVRILCKDDCKGICTKCRKNLNVEPCQCK